MSFRYEGGEINLTELVTASYFTENNQEYPYGGNAAKTEPVLKIASKVSVARRLLLKKEWNRNLGLIVLGEDSLQRGKTELPELIERRSIQYVYLCTHVDSESSATLLANYETANLFACTKDFLLENSSNLVVANPYTQQLSKQIDAIVDHKIEDITLDGFIDWDELKEFKRAVHFIKSSEYETDEKDDFIVQAYSLMNLFLTAVFSIKELEKNISDGKVVNVETPERRIEHMESVYKSFPDYLIPKAKEIIDCLVSVYAESHEYTNKQRKLEEIISRNRGKRICVVVPKAYYAALINENFQEYRNVTVITVNKFDNNQIYDLIICVGNIGGRRFDLFRCKTAQQTVVLLYMCETYQYLKNIRRAAKDEHLLNKRSTIIVTDEDYEEAQVGDIEDDVKELESIDEEINEFEGGYCKNC